MADLPRSVSDTRSNKNEQVLHAVEVLGRSKHRRAVFEAIFYHKRRIKTVTEISERTGLPRMRVLQEGRRLVTGQLVGQTKKDGETAYVQDPFYQTNKKKIFQLLDSKEAKKTYPTKRSRGGSTQAPSVSDLRQGKAVLVTVDDIDSFSDVKGVEPIQAHPLSEQEFKVGLQNILSEDGVFKDWGGEDCDLFTTRMSITGRRVPVAVALKGPAHKGTLRPSGMGKNADQIQRLLRTPATVFLIQYEGQIAASVIDQLQKLADLRARERGEDLYYGVIDGRDSRRLRVAYPKAFSGLD